MKYRYYKTNEAARLGTRKASTKRLISEYKSYNQEFRNLARDEFKKRGVQASKLPYTKRKVSERRYNILDYI